MSHPQTTLIGSSNTMQATLEQVSGIAALNRPALVIGERGTGKELIAGRLHYLSARWERPLIRMNCAAVTESLLESELFGHEAGAFTGAMKQRVGRFEQAHGGSLFLDEVANMSLRLQEKILRVVEYGEFERVGGQRTLEVDVRIIGATHADLPGLAAKGRFRADLLDRLSFAVITLPPLRARGEDILQLAEHFATAMARELGLGVFPGFSQHAQAQLLDYDWPGNVRELKNVAERAMYEWHNEHGPIDKVALDPFASPFRPPPDQRPCETTQAPERRDAPRTTFPLDLKRELSQLEQRLTREALKKNHYHQRRTADDLGLSYHQLRAVLRKHPGLLET